MKTISWGELALRKFGFQRQWRLQTIIMMHDHELQTNRKLRIETEYFGERNWWKRAFAPENASFQSKNCAHNRKAVKCQCISFIYFTVIKHFHPAQPKMLGKCAENARFRNSIGKNNYETYEIKCYSKVFTFLPPFLSPQIAVFHVFTSFCACSDGCAMCMALQLIYGQRLFKHSPFARQHFCGALCKTTRILSRANAYNDCNWKLHLLKLLTTRITKQRHAFCD